MTQKSSLYGNPDSTRELEICMLQGVARSGKTTISESLVAAYDFVTIGVGGYWRALTSYYLQCRPDQIGAFDPDVFTRFMEDEAANVQAVLRGDLVPTYDLDHKYVRQHVADLGDKPTISHKVVNAFVCEQLAQMNRDGVEAVFLEGRSWDVILTELIAQGVHIGRIIANLYIDVSDEEAANRQERKSAMLNIPFNREKELARIRKRNLQDRNRQIYPMQLPDDAIKITQAISVEEASTLGKNALSVVTAERPAPQCIYILTDDLSPKQAEDMTKAIVSGASPRLAAKANRNRAS